MCFDFIDKKESDPSGRLCDKECAGKKTEKCGGSEYASVFVGFSCSPDAKKLKGLVEAAEAKAASAKGRHRRHRD